MNGADPLDPLFRSAVAAMDAGDQAALEQLLAAHPALLVARLDIPGPWLREKVGGALEGFFQRPYLLWFVAEDPVRNGKLPPNIAQIASAVILRARAAETASLQEQLDYALNLVSWSWIARESGVQIALIDALADAGAALDGNPENALVNANFAAAEHLVARGAALTLATALCLGRWDDSARLGQAVGARERQFALTLAALRGKAGALSFMLGLGVDLNAPSPDLFPHATALHHAVHSGSLEAVRVLAEAGAALDVKDTVHGGTPLGWAEHAKHAEIAAYLRAKGAGHPGAPAPRP
jgi:peptide-methionine (S)-S-oxide reductase